MVNSNWARWICASVGKHFDNAKGDVYLYFDGDDRDTAKRADFAEFRIDGPRYKELSRGYWQVDVFVNVLIQSTLNDTDAFKFLKTAGIMTAAFAEKILVRQVGNGPNDDRDVVLGCLLFVAEDGLRTNQFGIVDETVRTQQGTIEGHYRMHLRE